MICLGEEETKLTSQTEAAIKRKSVHGQKTRKGRKVVHSLINAKENKNKFGKLLFTNLMEG